MSLGQKGKKKLPRSKEHSMKIGDAIRGRKHTQKELSKMRVAHSLEKHHNWKGGISKNKDYFKNRDKNLPEEKKRKLYWHRNLRNRMKRSASGNHSFKEWEKLKKDFNFSCVCCKKSEPEIKLTEDHIVPVSKGGSNDISNIQPLCKSCNCRKHDKIINYIN